MTTATETTRNTKNETAAEALERIQSGYSKNDIAAICQFAECGIDPDDITPRDNVLTFRAWKAKGRRVAKGAISLRVTVWIPMRERGDNGEEKLRPKTTCLFHELQTVPADAPKGTRPDAWDNPKLVRKGTYEPEATNT